MVSIIKGNVFASDAGLIAHGCNTQGGFGSGVAAIVATEFPKVRNAYLSKHHGEGWQLGDVQFVQNAAGPTIANCATQKYYTPRGVCHADYEAIRTCMEKVKEYAKTNNLTVALPKIGAGLAGGDWIIIKKILDEVFVDYDCTVHYLE